MEKEKTALFIRCSADLKKQLEKLAAEDNRSLNSYIVTKLKQLVEQGD